MIDKVYVADDLHYTLPEACKIQSPIMANGTGKIGLKQIRMIEFQGEKSKSILQAVEIIPMEIPDSLLLF